MNDKVPQSSLPTGVDSKLAERAGPPGADTPGIHGVDTVRYHDNEGRTAAGLRIDLPGYEIQEELGRGGMGVVYRAWQTPLKRPVALKMILAGAHADTRELARFRAEAEAVAHMQHPNIIQIYDIGEYAGLPYFSMEFAGGGALDRKLNSTPLPARSAAELTATLARAMHVAHQRGIVHRDLKPGNVLLAYGSGGANAEDTATDAISLTVTSRVPLSGLVPKIADFGLAKRIEGEGLTNTGAILGTPSYMAPEQAWGFGKVVGPAADQHALGAMLYEMLTGRPPYRAETPLDTVMQVVSTEPVPPSRLNPKVPHDLETICLKCLRKEIGKRYGDTLQLAEDLERWLRGEPIHARPIPLWERTLKWVRRRPAAAAVLALLGVLFVGLCAGTLLLSSAHQSEHDARGQATFALTLAQKREQDAKDERDLAIAAKLRADRAEQEALRSEKVAVHERDNAAAAKKTADEQADRARRSEAATKAVLGYFQKQVLSAARPKDLGGRGPEVTVLAALDAAEAVITQSFSEQPAIEDSVRATLGYTYRDLGDGPGGVRQWQRVLDLRTDRLGPDHADTLESLYNLAAAHLEAGHHDKAVEMFQKTLAGRQMHLGADHPDTLLTMTSLAAAYQAAGHISLALEAFQKALDLQKAKLGPDHETTVTTMNDLALAYQFAGDLRKAVPLLEETLAKHQKLLGPTHPKTLGSMNNLGLGYRAAGANAKALPLFQDALAKQQETLGPTHPDSLATMNNLASAWQTARRLDQAVPLFEDTLAKYQEKLGADHPKTLVVMNNLALAYSESKRLDLAVSLNEKLLEIRRKKLGADHPDTLFTMNNLAANYQAGGKTELARDLLEQCLAKRKEKLGLDHVDTLVSMINLSAVYKKAGQIDKAVPLLEDAVEKCQAKLGGDHAYTNIARAYLAPLYWTTKEFERAIPLYKEVLKYREAQLGPNHVETVLALSSLAMSYRDAGQVQQAVPLFEEALKRGRLKSGAFPAPLAGLPGNAATAFERAGAFAKAEPLLRDLLEQARKQYGDDDVRTAAAQATMGINLARQKKYAEAEPLLIAGYEGMKKQEAAIPAKDSGRLDEVVMQLIQLYEATGQSDKAEVWRKKKRKE